MNNPSIFENRCRDSYLQSDLLLKLYPDAYRGLLLKVSNIIPLIKLPEVFPARYACDVLPPVSGNYVQVEYLVGDSIDLKNRIKFVYDVNKGYYKSIVIRPILNLASYPHDVLEEVTKGTYTCDFNFAKNVVEIWNRAENILDLERKTNQHINCIASLMDLPENENVFQTSEVYFYDRMNFFKPVSLDFIVSDV